MERRIEGLSYGLRVIPTSGGNKGAQVVLHDGHITGEWERLRDEFIRGADITETNEAKTEAIVCKLCRRCNSGADVYYVIDGRLDVGLLTRGTVLDKHNVTDDWRMRQSMKNIRNRFSLQISILETSTSGTCTRSSAASSSSASGAVVTDPVACLRLSRIVHRDAIVIVLRTLEHIDSADAI